MTWEQATTELVKVSVDSRAGLLKTTWVVVRCLFLVVVSGGR